MQRAEAVLLGRGTIVPLSPTSHCLWKRNVDKIFVETQTGVYTWKYHPAHVHSLYGIPALHPPPPIYQTPHCWESTSWRHASTTQSTHSTVR